MSDQSAGKIRWNLIREKVPSTVIPLLDEIEKACSGDVEDPAREIELAFREKISALGARFTALKDAEKAS